MVLPINLFALLTLVFVLPAIVIVALVIYMVSSSSKNINKKVVIPLKPQNTLFIISGPSGSGKTTSIKQVMDREVKSFTTRAPRDGEVEGEDYLFTTMDKINELDRNGALVERVTYDGNSYGITKKELNEKLLEGDAFVIVDFHGYEQISKLYPNCVSIFFKIDVEDARQRMEKRGDNPDGINKRLATYEKELGNHTHYDYVLHNENGKQEQTIKELTSIISKHSKVDKLKNLA